MSEESFVQESEDQQMQEVSQALINTCKSFQDYFQLEVPEDPVDCIQWIKQIMEMTRGKIEDAETTIHSSAEIYEEMLQKSEEEVREHFKIEQQLRIYIENLQQKIEDYERKVLPNEAAQAKEAIEQLKKKNVILKQEIKKKSEELKKTKEIEKIQNESIEYQISKEDKEKEIQQLRSQILKKEDQLLKLKQENYSLNFHLQKTNSLKKKKKKENKTYDLILKQISFSKQIKPIVKKGSQLKQKQTAHTDRYSKENSIYHSKDLSARDLVEKDYRSGVNFYIQRKSARSATKSSGRTSSNDRPKTNQPSKYIANIYATYQTMKKPSSAIFSKKKMI